MLCTNAPENRQREHLLVPGRDAGVTEISHPLDHEVLFGSALITETHPSERDSTAVFSCLSANRATPAPHYTPAQDKHRDAHGKKDRRNVTTSVWFFPCKRMSHA